MLNKWSLFCGLNNVYESENRTILKGAFTWKSLGSSFCGFPLQVVRMVSYLMQHTDTFWGSCSKRHSLKKTRQHFFHLLLLSQFPAAVVCFECSSAASTPAKTCSCKMKGGEQVNTFLSWDSLRSGFETIVCTCTYHSDTVRSIDYIQLQSFPKYCTVHNNFSELNCLTYAQTI